MRSIRVAGAERASSWPFAVLLSLPPHRIALVIGNNAYENVPQLQKAVNDADSIAAELSKATVGQQAKSDLVQPA